jgi:hypothetical protein
MFCERFSNSQLALLKNSWAEERRTLIARRAKSLIEDWNRDNPRMKIPNQPTSDATVEDHNLFQEKWLQLEGCWEVNRESFDDILEKAMKIITTVSSGRLNLFFGGSYNCFNQLCSLDVVACLNLLFCPCFCL